MSSNRILIASVLCLVIGLNVILDFCHGNAGFNFGYPFSGASLQVCLTTTGFPAVAGFVLTVIGILLLLVAFFVAIAAQFKSPGAAANRP